MFHRFQIGDAAATIVSDGPLTLPTAAKIFHGPGKDALDAAVSAVGQPTDAVRVEQNCLLLDTGGKRVLFDNGLGSEKLYGPDSGKLLASLAEAGVDPASIDAMVLSKHLLPLRDRMRFIRDGEEFLPGVQAWFTPGHTPGHMAFLFTGGWCLTGDVAFHDPISYAFPEAESAFDVDAQLAVATRRRLLDRLVDEHMLVIGYHHPWPGLGHVERANGTFRFIRND
jgi:glyoxylase-like metal-dependent hydrolase (beta-lactamase superfamily II)